jgi:hypothetical protein
VEQAFQSGFRACNADILVGASARLLVAAMPLCGVANPGRSRLSEMTKKSEKAY